MRSSCPHDGRHPSSRPRRSGYYRDPFASLGHRRLSIIDVAGGHQPMSNEDGALWITYNGEIFNHADLRPALEQAGHRYRTRCDTETILHAYEQYGPDCVTRFRGMFAFAIWDKNTRTLFCARDRLGKKPFYYYWDGRLFAFASEIKALLAHPAIFPRFEESLLSEYLNFGYCSGEQTLFSGIRKLMPGHWLRLTSEQLEIRQYWEIPCPVLRKIKPRRPILDRRMPQSSGRSCPHAPDERRAPRHVSLRRRRFQRHRRSHEAHVHWAGQNLRRRLPRESLSANSPTPARSRTKSAPSTTKSSSAGTISSMRCPN
jgi:hypothetical protein